MDRDTHGSGAPMAAGRSRIATSPCSETRTVWLPDEWAVYIANGDDPESPDWPIELCEEELRRLRLEGFDTLTCTDRTRDLREYRGVTGTLRAYEALRVGGNDIVTRTVTLVRERLSPPGGEVARQILLDAKVALTRSESQPAERLAARALLKASGRERRVARAWGDTAGTPLEPVWLHIDIEHDSEPLPRGAWSDRAAVDSRLDGRNCVARIVLKDPHAPMRREAAPAWCRHAPFYEPRRPDALHRMRRIEAHRRQRQPAAASDRLPRVLSELRPAGLAPRHPREREGRLAQQACRRPRRLPAPVDGAHRPGALAGPGRRGRHAPNVIVSIAASFAPTARTPPASRNDRPSTATEIVNNSLSPRRLVRRPEETEMQIYGAYTRGIQGHLFTVSATPNRAGRLHVAGVRDTVAQQTAATVTHALKRLGIGDVGADVRLEPAGAEDPPLDTGRYSSTLDLPVALALLGAAGSSRWTGLPASWPSAASTPSPRTREPACGASAAAARPPSPTPPRRAACG